MGCCGNKTIHQIPIPQTHYFSSASSDGKPSFTLLFFFRVSCSRASQARGHAQRKLSLRRGPRLLHDSPHEQIQQRRNRSLPRPSGFRSPFQSHVFPFFVWVPRNCDLERDCWLMRKCHFSLLGLIAEKI